MDNKSTKETILSPETFLLLSGPLAAAILRSESNEENQNDILKAYADYIKKSRDSRQSVHINRNEDDDDFDFDNDDDDDGNDSFDIDVDEAMSKAILGLLINAVSGAGKKPETETARAKDGGNPPAKTAASPAPFRDGDVVYVSHPDGYIEKHVPRHHGLFFGRVSAVLNNGEAVMVDFGNGESWAYLPQELSPKSDLENLSIAAFEKGFGLEINAARTLLPSEN